MTNTETPAQIVKRVSAEARAAADQLPFEERANLMREVVKAVRDAVKFDSTSGGAPKGREWEMERLDKIGDITEDYFYDALEAKRSRAE